METCLRLPLAWDLSSETRHRSYRLEVEMDVVYIVKMVTKGHEATEGRGVVAGGSASSAERFATFSEYEHGALSSQVFRGSSVAPNIRNVCNLGRALACWYG